MNAGEALAEFEDALRQAFGLSPNVSVTVQRFRIDRPNEFSQSLNIYISELLITDYGDRP